MRRKVFAVLCIVLFSGLSYKLFYVNKTIAVISLDSAPVKEFYFSSRLVWFAGKAYYLPQKGDTLSDIAEYIKNTELKTSWQKLAEWNGLKEPYALKVGKPVRLQKQSLNEKLPSMSELATQALTSKHLNPDS